MDFEGWEFKALKIHSCCKSAAVSTSLTMVFLGSHQHVTVMMKIPTLGFTFELGSRVMGVFFHPHISNRLIRSDWRLIHLCLCSDDSDFRLTHPELAAASVGRLRGLFIDGFRWKNTELYSEHLMSHAHMLAVSLQYRAKLYPNVSNHATWLGKKMAQLNLSWFIIAAREALLHDSLLIVTV